MSLPRTHRHGRDVVVCSPLTTSFALMSVTGSAEEAVATTLRYSAAEPFLIRARFRLDGGRTVEWVLSRELLRDGVVTAAGLGDIRFFPGDDGLLVELRSHQGRAFLHGALEPFTDFVAQTYALVPAGAEDRFYSLDDELSQLLADPDRFRADPA